MNTETENGENSLGGAFGDRGTNVNAIAYGHPHAESIIEEARQVFAESETGRGFLKIWDYNRIPVSVMKGNGEGGFSADMGTIILQVPRKTKNATGEIIFDLARAIRDADQEYGGLKTPDPMKDIMAYATFIHARNLDSITYVCKFIKELTNSSYFPVLLDSLKVLGLNSFYKAYVNGEPKDKLYSYYAEAYDKRGSI